MRGRGVLGTGGGGGGCCTRCDIVLHTAASSPTIWLAGRPVGPKPEATWEEWAVGEMIQAPHPQL